jgi:hypothetical protein
MKKEDRELLELRHKTLALNDDLNMVAQLSWRLKQTKESYSFDSKDAAEWEMLYTELLCIQQDFLDYAKKVLKEKEDEETEK